MYCGTCVHRNAGISDREDRRWFKYPKALMCGGMRMTLALCQPAFALSLYEDFLLLLICEIPLRTDPHGDGKKQNDQDGDSDQTPVSQKIDCLSTRDSADGGYFQFAPRGDAHCCARPLLSVPSWLLI